MAKKKDNEEVIQVAQGIASDIETIRAVKAPKEKAPKVKEEKVEVVKAEKLEQPKTSPTRNQRIKAVVSARGQFGNLRYEIKAGEVYTFPKALAEWLVETGRAF